MPVRPREMNDQPTEARNRDVIRSIVNQEIRRILTSAGALTIQVNTNTSNISANASGIATNVIDIDNLERRSAARNIQGIESTVAVSAGGSTITEDETAFSATQVWTVTIAEEPLVTLWSLFSFDLNHQFDTQQFDTMQFNAASQVNRTNTTATVSYRAETNSFSIDWGSAKTGSLFLITYGSNLAFAVVAVSD